MSRAAMVRPVLTLLSRDKDARAQVSDAVMGDEQVATRGATTAGLDAARQLARQIAQRRRARLAGGGDGTDATARTDAVSDGDAEDRGADDRAIDASASRDARDTGTAARNPAMELARTIQARRREEAQVGPIKGFGLGIEQSGPQTVANTARKAQTAIAGVQQAPEIAAGFMSRNTAAGRAVRTDLRTPVAQPAGANEDARRVRDNVSDAAMRREREDARMTGGEAKTRQDMADARDAQTRTKSDTLTRVRDWLGTVAQEFGATAQEMDTRNQSRMTREGVGGAVTRFAYDAGKSAAPMAASVAATVAGGAVAGPGGALAAGFATSFVTEGGDTAQTVYDDLRAQNMSEEEALASAFYAAAPAGAAKAAIEQFGAEKVFRGLLKPFAQRVGVQSESVMRRAATQWATAALAEAGEEVSQGTVDRTVRTVTTGQGAEPVSWQALREMGREALLGGVMGGAMAGPGVALQARQDAKARRASKAAASARDAIRAGDAAGTNATDAGTEGAGRAGETTTTPADARTATNPSAAVSPDDAGSVARGQDARVPEKTAEGESGEQRAENADAASRTHASEQDGAEVDARIDEIVDELDGLDTGEADDARRRELLNELARLRGEEVSAQAGQQDGVQSTGTGDASDAAQNERGTEAAQMGQVAEQQLPDQRGQPANARGVAGGDTDARVLADDDGVRRSRVAGGGGEVAGGADWVGDGVVRGDAPGAGVGAARGRVSGSDQAPSGVEAGKGGAGGAGGVGGAGAVETQGSDEGALTEEAVTARDVAAIAQATGKPTRVAAPATEAQQRMVEGAARMGRRVRFIDGAEEFDGTALVGGGRGDVRTVYINAKLATDEDAAPILAHETLHLAVAQDPALRAELAGMMPTEELAAAAAQYREKLVRSFTNDHPAVKRFDSDAQVREEEAVASLLQEAAAATPQGMKLARQLYETPGLLERIRQQIVKALDAVGVKRMAPQTKAMMRLLDQVVKNAKEGKRRAKAEARVEASRARAEGTKGRGGEGLRGRKGQEAAAKTPMLFAPSDRPSNPADAEAAQRAWVALGTRSPWFKSWFGDWEVAAARATRERSGQLARPVPLVVSDAPLQNAKVEQDAASAAAKSIASDTKVRNTDTGWSIAVPRRSLRKPMSHAADPAQARSVALVPQLLEHAVLIGTHQNHRVEERQNVPRIHNLVAPVRIAGTLYRAHMTIKEMADGQRYYDHDLTMLEKAGLEKAGTKENGPPSARLAANPRLADSGPVSISIGELLGDVKPVSKAVTENGGPRVMYHGTASEFTVFRAGGTRKPGHGRQAKAMYFTPEAASAAAYGRTAANAKDASRDDSGAVMPVYLKIANPAVYTSPQAFARASAASVQRGGHDGMIRTDANGDVLEAAVFEPSQVKSATGNSGTFDAGNADIRFAPSGKRAEGKEGADGDSQDKTRAEARARASEERARAAEERADRAELAKGVQAAMVKERVKKYAQDAKEADREIAALEKKVDREKVKAQSEKATARETLTTLRTMLRAATKRSGSLTKAVEVLDAVAARMEAQSQIRDVELANAASDNRARFKENNKLRAENRRLKEEAKANLASERRVADARETATRAEAKAKAAAMTQAQRDRERVREELVRLVTKLVPAERQGAFIRDVRDVKNTGELYEITGRIMKEATDAQARTIIAKTQKITGLSDIKKLQDVGTVDRAFSRGRLNVLSNLRLDAEGNLVDAGKKSDGGKDASRQQYVRQALERFVRAGERFDAAKSLDDRVKALGELEEAYLDMATALHAAKLELTSLQARRRRGAASVARAIVERLESTAAKTRMEELGETVGSLAIRKMMYWGDIETFATLVDGKREGGAFSENVVKPLVRAERAYKELRHTMLEDMDRIARNAGFGSLADAQARVGTALGPAAMERYTLATPIDMPGMKGITQMPAGLALDIYATDPQTLAGMLAGRPQHLGDALETDQSFVITPDMYQTIVNAIPPAHRAMVDEMKAVTNQHFAAMKRAVYELEGRDLEAVDMQHPRIINQQWVDAHQKESKVKTGTDSTAGDPRHVFDVLAASGITQNRKSDVAPMVLSDFFTKHMNKVEIMARVIHTAGPVRDAQLALKSPSLSTAMNNQVHPLAMARATTFINDVAGKPVNAGDPHKVPARIVRSSVRASARVGRSLVQLFTASWLRNLGGLSMLKADMGRPLARAGIARMFGTPWSEIVAKSQYIRHEFGMSYVDMKGQDQAQLKSTQGSAWESFRRAATAAMRSLSRAKGGMASVRERGVTRTLRRLAHTTLDILTKQVPDAFSGINILGWWAGLSARAAYAGWMHEARRIAPSRGWTPQQAESWALERIERTLRRTQGSNQSATRAEIQSDARGTIWQPFFMFTNDSFRQYNLLAQSVIEGAAGYAAARREGESRGQALRRTRAARQLAANTLAGIVESAIIAAAVSGYWDPWAWMLGAEDEEKDKEQRQQRAWWVFRRDLAGALLPGVGDRIVEGLQAYNSSRGGSVFEAMASNPLISAIGGIFDGGEQMARGLEETIEGDNRAGNSGEENTFKGLMRAAMSGGSLVGVPGGGEINRFVRAWEKSSEQGTNRVENWLQTVSGD